MTTRDTTIGPALTERRREEAGKARARFVKFCDKIGAPPSEDLAPIYLTWLLESGAGRTALRRELAALDVDARLSGTSPWSKQPDVARWLRGALRGLPTARTQPRAAALYRELVEALCDGLLAPDFEQSIAVAATVLTNQTDLTVPRLARLRWSQVRVSPRQVAITRSIEPSTLPQVLEATDGIDCPVAALRGLKRISGGRGEFVLGGKGTTNDESRLRAALKSLPPAGRSGRRARVSSKALARVLRGLQEPPPQRVRDRVVISTAFAAALGTQEAVELRRGDIARVPQGLLIQVPGRRSTTAVLADSGSSACPVDAWSAWDRELRRQGLRGASRPAFFQVSGSVIWDKPMSPSGLNYLIHQRCQDARLHDDYTFTSLRIGFIRSALREDRPAYAIAAHSDLRSLTSVARHEARERLLSNNVAGLVGL